MKTSSILAAVAISFVASSAAVAGEATYELPRPATSQTTRAAVLADLQQARATGMLYNTEHGADRNDRFVATRTRADVRSETLAAIASGELQQLNREGGVYEFAARQPAAPAIVAAK